MAGETTNVLVEEIRLVATDHATPAAESVAKAMEHTAHAAKGAEQATQHAGAATTHMGSAAHGAAGHVGGLGGVFQHLKDHALGIAVGVTGLSVGFASLAEKAIEANRELGGVSKGVAQVNYAFQGWNKNIGQGDRVKIAKKEAAEVVEVFEGIETKLATPMADIGAAYRTVASSGFAKLGLSQQQVLDLTEKSIQASKVFGVTGEGAAESISKALQLRVIPKGLDPFNDKLRLVMGNMKNLSSAQIYERMKKGLGDLAPAAEAFSQGMGDNLFRIKDFFTDTLRDVAAPVFKKVVGYVQEWQKGLVASGSSVKEMVGVWGDKLVRVFDTVATSVKFLADHWQLFAAGIAAFKLPSALSALTGLAGGGGKLGVMGALKGIGGAAGGGLGGFVGSLAAAAGPLALLASGAVLAGEALLDLYKDHKALQAKAANLSGFFGAMGNVNKTQQYLKKHGGDLGQEGMEKGAGYIGEQMEAGRAELEKQGLLKNGVIEMEKFNEVMAAMSDDVRTKFLAALGQTGLTGDASSGMAGAMASEIFKKFNIPDVDKGEGSDHTPVKVAANFNGDIHITQDFKDQDPDRVWISFKNGLERQAENSLGSNLTTAVGM